MKKTLKIIALIILILLIGDIVISFLKQSPEDTFIRQDQNTASSIPAQSISSTLYENDIEKGTYSIHIKAHDVTGLPAAINKAVNDQIRKKISEIQESFIADVVDVKLTSEDQKHQLSIEASEPFAATEKTFYVEVLVGSYYSGSAHPLTYKTILNFITESGELVTLDSILNTNNPAPLKKISEVAAVKVKAKLQAALSSSDSGNTSDDEKQTVSSIFEPLGVSPSPENFSAFYILENGIRWTFSPYQVAPYVFGEIDILVPFAEISGSLADKTWLK